MPNLPPLATLHELLRLLNIKACGQLSQNFLFQPWSIQSIVNSAGDISRSNVLEVGPGPGGLTRSIIEKNPSHLAVVEIDHRFLIGLEQLKSAAARNNIQMDIYNQDILKFNYDHVFPQLAQTVHRDQAWDTADIGANEAENRRVHVIGNLPFQVSTILLCHWLNDISERRGLWKHARTPLTLTFQYEIGNRMRANNYDPERSRLSILSQSICEVQMKKIIPGSAFLPKAKVDVAVMHLVPRLTPLITVPFPYTNKLIKAVFQFKRKNLVSSMESLFPPQLCQLALEMFLGTKIDPEKFPIEVTMEEFQLLCAQYHKLCQENPTVFEYDFRNPKKEMILYSERKKMQRVILGETLNSPFIKSELERVSNNQSIP